MNSRVIAIGGGELKLGETFGIDSYIAEEAKKIAGGERPCGLFLPTASHDCMPYYNTFHKVYTGRLGVKTDVLLTVNREWDRARAREKIARAHFLYVGGGDTVFMLGHWRESGLCDLIGEAFEEGKLICGLSAGAICWFEEMYSDSVKEGEYAMYRGLGWLKGKISPHYNERTLDFDEVVLYNRFRAWGIENRAALEFSGGEAVKTISDGGTVFLLDGTDGKSVKKRRFGEETP